MRRRIPRVLAIALAAATLAGSCPDPPRLAGSGEIEFVDAAGSVELVSFQIRLGCKARWLRDLEVSWSAGTFELTNLGSMFCRDDPAFDPASADANFDTLVGGGRGTWQGVSGAYASFTFSDAGDGEIPDYAEITITAPDGAVVLDVAGSVQGNVEAIRSVAVVEPPG